MISRLCIAVLTFISVGCGYSRECPWLTGCTEEPTLAGLADLMAVGFPEDHVDYDGHGPTGGYQGNLVVGEQVPLWLEGEGMDGVQWSEWHADPCVSVEPRSATRAVLRGETPGRTQIHGIAHFKDGSTLRFLVWAETHWSPYGRGFARIGIIEVNP